MEVQTSSILRVSVSSSLTAFVSERRFDKGLTVAEIMQKLELITGSTTQHMQLEVYSKNDKFLFKLDNPEALLGSYHIDDEMRIHVIDKNPSGVQNYTDVSNVEKFELSDKAYETRQDTVRSFLKRNKLGKFDPEDQATRKQMEDEQKIQDEDALQRIKVGSRCKVAVPGQMVRRGEVKYVGYTEFKPNVWVGVQYDEPYGKHNGTVKGRSYFVCEQGYGAFVKPKHVECGDFEELDIDEDEEM